MDLPGVTTLARPVDRDALPPLDASAAWLAGGTWLFSEPQPALRTLVDLTTLRWPALEVSEAGLRIAATCTIAQLEAFEAPPAWQAAPLLAACCNALLGSFKVWNTATIGGNVCLALPAAPMLALTVALDGLASVWRPGGTEYQLPMAGFATGPQRTVLHQGDLLRAIDLPAAALQRRTALRQASLTTHGRSAALLVATRAGQGARHGAFTLTITASTIRPIHASWPAPPAPATIDAFIQDIPPALWHVDVHGTPAWRRHMTRRLAAELLDELA